MKNQLLMFSDIEAVTPEMTQFFEVRKKDKFRTTSVIGVDPVSDVLTKRMKDKIVGGTYLEENDDYDIILGSDLAGGRYEKDSILGGTRIQADIGDKVILTTQTGVEYEFKVKGIYRTKFLGLDIEALIPLETMEEITGTEGKASRMLVRIEDQDKSQKLKTELINSGIDGQPKSWEENAGFSRSVTASLGLVSQITRVIGILTAFVTVFIVIFIKTKNQRSQIATMRAVGVSDNVLVNSYVLEAVFLGIVGIMIGTFVMKLLIMYFAGSPLNLPIGDVVPIMTAKNQWNSIFLLLGATLFAGFYPSKKIMKENIIEAIRGGG
jgi:putative ABC transport system permease protein